MSSLRKLLASTPYPRPRNFRPRRKEICEEEVGRLTNSLETEESQTGVTERRTEGGITEKSQETRSVSNPKVSKTMNCPLEKLNVRPVGTSEHYLQRCYCYLCTCGGHVCPADLHKSFGSLTSRKSWKSSYQREYTKKNYTLTKSKTFHCQTALPSPRKMDLTTTQQHDFTPPVVPPPPKRPYNPPKSTVKLVSSTSYNRDFPDWKPKEIVYYRPSEMPYRGDIVSFQGKSTYREEFVGEDKGEQFKAKKERKWKNPIAILKDFYGTTSHKAEYKAPLTSTHPSLTGPKFNLQIPSELHISPGPQSLTTTYKQSYQPTCVAPTIPFKLAARRSSTPPSRHY